MGDIPAVKTVGAKGSALLMASKHGDKAKPEQEVYGCGFESGPSRPPTPHGAGFPDNCAEVVQGIYRSSFPLPVHISSIAQLGLKTIVTLVEEEWSPEYREFVKNSGITSHIIPILANKDPEIYTPASTVVQVLNILLDPRNHPVLVHCNKGKHRTGCIMACFRKAQGWSCLSALSEYLYFASPKARVLDRNYIQSFDETLVTDLVKRVGAEQWLPSFPPIKHTLDGGKEENYLVNGNKGKKPELGTSAPPATFHGNLKELRHTNSI
ncbi:hypothetical protein FQN49_002504 [Arthroderma sp. PD_2]|nr:hypothetical protein FQN49_002504 [Arthroderma sp. PD_2]